MMLTKLQKHKSYQYKDKEHFKHVIVIPEKYIETLGWEPGTNLSFSMSDTGITISSTTVDTEEDEDDLE